MLNSRRQAIECDQTEAYGRLWSEIGYFVESPVLLLY